MKRRTALAAAPLVLLLSCLVGCEDGSTAPAGVVQIGFTHVVRISGTTAPISIVPDPVIVRRGDRIVWVHDSASLFRIDLPRPVPVDRPSTTGVAGVVVEGIAGIEGIASTDIVARPRLIDLDAKADTFKYTVYVTAGGRSDVADPRIIVKPD